MYYMSPPCKPVATADCVCKIISRRWSVCLCWTVSLLRVNLCCRLRVCTVATIYCQTRITHNYIIQLSVRFTFSTCFLFHFLWGVRVFNYFQTSLAPSWVSTPDTETQTEPRSPSQKVSDTLLFQLRRSGEEMGQLICADEDLSHITPYHTFRVT